MLCGCSENQNDRDDSYSPPAPHSGSSSTSTPIDPPVSAAVLPPLRRTAQTLSDEDPLSDLRLENLAEVPLFDATKLSDGSLSIKGQTLNANPESVDTLLRELGFKSVSEQNWLCLVGADETTRFIAKLADAENANRHLLTLMDRMRKISRNPGRVVFKHGAPLGGKLIYTGHPLDVAFEDSGSPHWYVAIKVEQDGKQEIAYLRGGRLFINDNNTVGIEQYALAGDALRVPTDTQQLTIANDGKLTALHRNGLHEEIGQLPIHKIDTPESPPDDVVRVIKRDGLVRTANPHPPGLSIDDKPLRPGHLEFAEFSRICPFADCEEELWKRQVLERLAYAIAHPFSSSTATPAAASEEPITIHADLPWSEHHLKALGISVEHSGTKTVISCCGDAKKLSTAFAKVLQVLRMRLALHDQNLRNADKVRDADGKLSPYRRKVLTINAQGDPVEGDDPSPFPKTYKLGDPNADAEGFVVLPNVNRAVELSEFQSARDEYKMIKAAAERLDPRSVFPDPPSPP
jgi:flagellar basal-body rod protein FlgC